MPFDTQGSVLLYDNESVASFFNRMDARVVALILNKYVETLSAKDIEELWARISTEVDDERRSGIAEISTEDPEKGD